MTEALVRHLAGYREHLGYRIVLTPIRKHVEAWAGARRLAATARALKLDEQDHAPVIYWPEDDVHWAALRPVDGHWTHCPFKGDASYFALLGAPNDPIAWTYADPYPEVAAITRRVAFYAHRVMIRPGADRG